MRCLRLAALFLACPVHAAAGIVTVRVVDGWWRPLPGASVALIATSDCARPAPSITDAKPELTDHNGLKDFEFGGSVTYWVLVKGGGGFRSYLECVDLGRTQTASDRAYFQARVTLDPLDGPKVENPATNTLALTGITALVGAYRDDANNGYQVGFHNGNLSLEGPDGKTRLFPLRRQGDGVPNGHENAFSVDRDSQGHRCGGKDARFLG